MDELMHYLNCWANPNQCIFCLFWTEKTSLFDFRIWKNWSSHHRPRFHDDWRNLKRTVLLTAHKVIIQKTCMNTRFQKTLSRSNQFCNRCTIGQMSGVTDSIAPIVPKTGYEHTKFHCLLDIRGIHIHHSYWVHLWFAHAVFEEHSLPQMNLECHA